MAFDDEALNNALIMAGLGIMGGRGSAWDKLAQGGMFGLQGYNQVLTAREQKKLQDAKLEEERQQAEQRKLAMQKAQMDLERQQRLAQILTGAVAPTVQPAGSQRSVVDAPGWTPQVPQVPQGDSREKTIRMLADAGFTKEAEDQLKIMQGLEGKAHGGIEVDKDGKPFYMTDRGPRYTTGGFVPRDKLVDVNLGGQVGFRTEYDPTIRARVDKTMTLAEQDAARRGWATFGLDKARFDRGELREGPVAGGTALGWVTPGGFNPVPGTTTKAPELPGSIIEKIANNDVAIAKIDQALEEVQNNPSAFGARNLVGDAVRQRTDPTGVKARALVADIGSQKIHDRSGAAVTAAEMPRLAPFIPDSTDTPEVVVSKLTQFRKEYAMLNDELKRGRSISQMMGPPVSAPNAPGGRVPSPAEIEAELLRRGIKP